MPRALWLLPLAIALLRGLPYLAAVLSDPGDGQVALPVGYIPKDFLQYLAFMRQGADGVWLAVDPFTTEAQSGRFFLPFFALLGRAAHAVALPLPLALELVRIPLLFGLFAVVWRFLAALLPDRRERSLGCLLIGLSGGIEGAARWLVTSLPTPAALAEPLLLDTWPLYGWNTFQLAYNPLWIAGLCFELLILEAVFRRSDDGWTRLTLRLAPLFLGLWWTHPYTALATLAALTSMAIAGAVLREAAETRAQPLRVALALTPALVIIVPFAMWQGQDAVYQAAASNVFGGRGLAPFWYPLTLGVLGWLAILGLRQWSREARPHSTALWAWIGGAVLLHSSSLVNGYHFVSQLHVPLCIVAAPAALARYDAWRAGRGPRVATAFAAAALFATVVFSTAEAVRDARSDSRISASASRIVSRLEREAPSHVMAPPALAAALPAFTPHRVWVGHHFLTPNFHARAREQRRLLNQPGQEAALIKLVEAQNIDFIVVATPEAGRLSAALGSRVAGSERVGEMTLIRLLQE